MEKSKTKVYRVFFKTKDNSLDSLLYRGRSQEEARQHFRNRGYKVVKVKLNTSL